MEPDGEQWSLMDPMGIWTSLMESDGAKRSLMDLMGI